MASHAIRRVSTDGIGYSVVELNDVRHVFAAATPTCEGSLRNQAADALRTIDAAACAEGVHGAIVNQAVFVADADLIGECREIMRSHYGGELPATSYILQPPCHGKLLAIEAMGIGLGAEGTRIERVDERLVIESHDGVSWVHCADISSGASRTPVYEAASEGFASLEALLARAGVRFDQVARTWLYLGGIVDDDDGVQRYKELNRARADFYRDVPFAASRRRAGGPRTAYPASTGIGADGRGITVSAIALSTDRDDILIAPLENPRQVSAFDYSEVHSPDSPKFSRAMAISCGPYATIFVSGTASITQSETRHVGDVVAQTHETLDNIEALISEPNLACHGLAGLGAELDGLAFARVYVKRPADYARVRAVCEERFGELPTIYAIADVCRPELLVEIEGLAFSRAQSPLAESAVFAALPGT